MRVFRPCQPEECRASYLAKRHSDLKKTSNTRTDKYLSAVVASWHHYKHNMMKTVRLLMF